MDDKLLRKVQLVQLEMAKEVKRVCEKHHIKYFLDSGTLLGAVRHKGFIPWDDDLDIGMLRKDYEKFIQLAPKELGADFFLQNWYEDPGYGYSFSKVIKKNTVYVEKVLEESDSMNGIYIDIFPYDNYPDHLFQRFLQGVSMITSTSCLRCKSNYKTWKNGDGIDFLKFIVYLPFRILSKFMKRSYLVELYDKHTVKYNNRRTKNMFEPGVRYGKWVIPSGCFSDFVELKFEDDYFKCPADYDGYLKSAYGDYMKLPDEDQRGSHQIVEVKL